MSIFGISDLIRAISSYLRQKEFETFSTVNKLIYATNERLVISELSHSSFPVYLLPNLKSLKLNIDIPLVDAKGVCNTLKDVLLHWERDDDACYEADLHALLEAVINQTVFDFSNVKVLAIDNVWPDIGQVPLYPFVQLLSKFPKCESLLLNLIIFDDTLRVPGLGINAVISNQEMLKFRHLKSLNIGSSVLALLSNFLVNTFSEQLESLTTDISDGIDQIVIDPCSNFSQLCELSLRGSSTVQQITQILKTAEKLTKFYVFLDAVDDQDAFTGLLGKLIARHKLMTINLFTNCGVRHSNNSICWPGRHALFVTINIIAIEQMIKVKFSRSNIASKFEQLINIVQSNNLGYQCEVQFETDSDSD